MGSAQHVNVTVYPIYVNGQLIGTETVLGGDGEHQQRLCTFRIAQQLLYCFRAQLAHQLALSCSPVRG